MRKSASREVNASWLAGGSRIAECFVSVRRGWSISVGNSPLKVELESISNDRA